MIITKLRIQEEHPMSGTSLSYPLPTCDLNLDSSAGENGYILKEVTGLDTPKLTPIVEGFDITGIPIMTSIPEVREFVFKIGLNPGLGQSYSSLRDNLYKLIDRTVFVNLMNDSIIIAQTKGHITQFEAVHFTDLPEIVITIECQDGELSSPKNISIPLIDITNKTEPVINYNEGTAPTGLELKFTCTGAKAGFRIFNHSGFWHSGNIDVYNQFYLNYTFLTNDVVTISTQTKNKRITVLRGVTTYDLAGYLNKGAVWPKLYPGVNVFSWDLNTALTWISASYIPKYWGV